MKIYVHFFLFLLTIGVTSSCSKKITNPLEYEKPKVTFGNGGGIAGIETSYMILENGKIFKLTELGKNYSYIGQIDRNKVTQFFETFKLLTFDNMELNDPGNTYKFIEIDSKGASNRLTWGNSAVDKNLTLLYQILMNYTTTLLTNK